jgi:hypothetical protein
MRELSRGQFLRRGAVTIGGVAGFGLADAAAAFGRTAGSPNPIPGGFDSTFTTMVPTGAAFHVLPPVVGFEMSSITDFNGIVGAADTQGTAHGSDGKAYSFDTDMRFMMGSYIDADGRLRTGSFGFI